MEETIGVEEMTVNEVRETILKMNVNKPLDLE